MQRMVFLLALLCLLQCTFAQTSASTPIASLTSIALPSGVVVDAAKDGDDPGREKQDAVTSSQSSTTPAVLSTGKSSSRSASVHLSQRPVSHIPTAATRTNHWTRTSHSLPIHTTPAVHPFPHPSNPLSPDSPVPHHHPPDPPPADPAQSSRKHGQPVVAIVFEVIAGVVGAFIIFMVSRCLYSWRRAPDRDRIGALLSRHYLHQEMEERERHDLEQRILRSSSVLRPPPPPYIRAPAYEEVVGEERV